jgi:small subunit ribosomal protein S19e
MVTVYDVSPDKLIEEVATKLKEFEDIQAPEWAFFAKTGRHKESSPIQEDWWYTRAASVLRKVYMMGPIGTSRLAGEYGDFADRGVQPNKAIKGSGSIARKCMMQLESSGLIVRDGNKGRVVTPKGRSLLDNAAMEARNKASS